MKVLFTKIARQELEDAIRYYELQHSGLGSRFKEETRQATLRIAAHPEAWPRERGEVRKYVLPKFPYKLMYSIEKDRILILAVAHQHRRPDYWVDRNDP